MSIKTGEVQTVKHQTLHTWMREDFPAVAVQMRIEHKDEVETESTGTGTGHILTVMTDLSTKGLGILALEIISTAKACDNEGRANIANWLAIVDPNFQTVN